MENPPNPKMKKLGDLEPGSVYRRPNNTDRFSKQHEYWMKSRGGLHQPVQKGPGKAWVIDADDHANVNSNSPVDPDEIVELVE